MPAPLRIRLTAEEEKKLVNLSNNPNTPKRTRERAEALRLNGLGWKVQKIAQYLNCAPNTVRQTIYRWVSVGWEGLWDKRRCGRKPVWQPADIEYIEECLDKEQRTYNSRQIAEKLQKERNVKLSADRIRKILKKKVASGKEREAVLDKSKTGSIKHKKPPI